MAFGDDYTFTGPADAVEHIGFLIVCNKAVTFIANHYGCSPKINLRELERGRQKWVDLGNPLPWKDYDPEKRDLLAIATLIEALADNVAFVRYYDGAGDAPEPLMEFPGQATAIVMGIILYDIVLRTRIQPRTEIKFIDLERISGKEMQNAVQALHEGRSRTHKFRQLISILEKFSTPIVFH
ncbi:hypothetical protein MesoLj131b_76700 (plasmid) [Mesorhizobium sp. 131-2-5]|uniref:hypothetical protein n=1 Tax=Mesorhizobium sp. 131-2-5 TaxID=2744519 RepID=UPI0018EC3900|nr:hypothetical protein [Mesorhizobium sp. 131-2-5]BCH05671.1 hypothetical protein MesoLj131b_76700 [Mesorhizobium sp. 131-2-5]